MELRVGDTMTEEQVEEWVNVLPPATYRADLVQLGEPYSHREDENGKWRATYPTAAKIAGQWRYMGNCFRGSTEAK
ncbi:hypothetical protein [Paenibacillus sp. GCM10012303]|uniref:hypothetical protein n=1 Tax=Paenibacillus sp. GCM10012303 TaxID=3317340 RepID=UPI003608A766